jgi:hypothetical protein
MGAGTINTHATALRFYLTPRGVVWSLAEVLEWIDAQRRKGREGCGPHPDYRVRSFNGASDGR